MIEKIKVTFDFGKLLNNLNKILDNNMDARKKIFAANAKDQIKNGRFKKLSPGTLYIRKHGLSFKSNLKSNSKKPLNYTGNLLASIKTNDEGIQFADYGKYHLEDYTIASNKFTDYMIEEHSMPMVGTTVPARNFLFTKAGKLTSKVRKQFKKIESDLYKGINRFLTR